MQSVLTRALHCASLRFSCFFLKPIVGLHMRVNMAMFAIVCAGWSSVTGANDAVLMHLKFAGEFAGQPYDCSANYENVGTGKTTVAVSDYRLYISRVRLLDAQGVETPVSLQERFPWQSASVALLDFENGSGHCTNGTSETNDQIVIEAPAGQYSGVAFDIGVPFESNHQDPTLASSPLNLTSLFWNWRGGYRFMRIDVVPVDSAASETENHKAEVGKTSAESTNAKEGMNDHESGLGMKAQGKSWAVHLGSTACLSPSRTRAPSSCEHPNRVAVAFSNIDPLGSTFVIDPARILVASDVTKNTEGTSPGCMSSADDPECQAVFQALGLGGVETSQVLLSVR